MKLYVANVGVNMDLEAKYGLRSPIFPDGTFEAIPIPLGRSYKELPTYQNLRSWTERGESLADFVPKRTLTLSVHACPDFGEFTYGDVDNPRAANLQGLTPGDQLWFLVRLWNHVGLNWTGESDFYLIDFLVVQIYLEISSKAEWKALPMNVHARIDKSADVRLAMADTDRDFRFRFVVGDANQSRRFENAYSGARRARFRNDPGHHSEMKPVTIPG